MDRHRLRLNSDHRFLWLAIALTLLVRGAYFLYAPAPFSSDPDAYLAIARTLDQSGVYGLPGPDSDPVATAFRPPLYPFLLSLLVRDGTLANTATGLFHGLLAALMSAWVFLTTRHLARRSGAENRFQNYAALAAAGLVAVDPILIKQSTELMTETLASTLSAGVLYFWCRIEGNTSDRGRAFYALAASGLLALAYLCRPTFLVWAVLLIAATATARPVRRALVTAAILASLVLLAVGGWTLRNLHQFDRPIWATTHGGYTLLLANNESFYDFLAGPHRGQAWDASAFLHAYRYRYEGDPREQTFWSQTWEGTPRVDHSITESEDDRLCYEAAVATIKRHPKQFIKSCRVRVIRLWAPWPLRTPERSLTSIAMIGVFYGLVYSAMLVSVVRHRRTLFRRPWWAMWTLLFALTAVHAVYWSNLRMRAPAIPAIAVTAALAAVRRPSDQSISNSKTLR